jgi:hypothetical protein
MGGVAEHVSVRFTRNGRIFRRRVRRVYRSDLDTWTCTRSPHRRRASRMPCAHRPFLMTTNCRIQADDRVAAVRGAQCYHGLPPHALLRSRLACQSQAATAAARLLPVVKLAPLSVLVAALACWSRDALCTRIGRVGQIGRTGRTGRIGRIEEMSIRLTSFGHQKQTAQRDDAFDRFRGRGSGWRTPSWCPKRERSRRLASTLPV